MEFLCAYGLGLGGGILWVKSLVSSTGDVKTSDEVVESRDSVDDVNALVLFLSA